MKRTNRKKERKSGRLRTDMIGSPQDDLRHTVHVGIDGAFFGDVSSFLGDKAQQAIVLNKKIDKYDQMPRRHSLKRPSLDLSGSGSPLLARVGNHGISNLASEHNQSDNTSEDHTDNRLTDSPESSHKQDNEHHDNSDEDDDINHKMEDFDSSLSSFDLGPSLMDEVFKALGDSPPLTPSELQQTTALNQDNDVHNVEPISPGDGRSLDSAIDMENEFASKSILELDNLTIGSSIDSDGPDLPSTPSSPTEHGSVFYVH